MKRLNSKVLNKIAAILLAAVAAATVMGCSGEKTIATENQADENVNEDTDVVESIPEEDEDTAEGTSFGLQDYEGFYCRTETEQIEDYEVTYTYGYLFNGDGTGVYYGQDVVDITWNETEIHFADSTEVFEMEPGKLTVGGIAYDKIAGNFIVPNPYDVDEDNVENGIYYAYIDKNGINETDDGLTIAVEIYTEDSYDIVDINRMAEGDVIYINGSLLPVNSIEQTDSGIININGGVENCGSALRAVDESNCYVYVGMDMEISYTRQGMANLPVSDNLKLTDNHDPAVVKEYEGNEAVLALKEIVEEYPLTCYDCRITIEEGAIVEINRMYRP